MTSYQTTVKMHQVDGAQRLFFAEQFVMAHDAWETWLAQAGVSIASLLARAEYVLPVVHAEADYAAPIALGDVVQVAITCQDIGHRSFTMGYILSKADGPALGRVSLVHAVVAKDTGKAIPLPAALRDLLQGAKDGEP